MPREELYLQDIIESANDIENFLAGISETDFLAGKLLQSAVLYKLANIGEAAARISENLKNRYPKIEWKLIIGFRNIAVHVYFSVDIIGNKKLKKYLPTKHTKNTKIRSKTKNNFLIFVCFVCFVGKYSYFRLMSSRFKDRLDNRNGRCASSQKTNSRNFTNRFSRF